MNKKEEHGAIRAIEPLNCIAIQRSHTKVKYDVRGESSLLGPKAKLSVYIRIPIQPQSCIGRFSGFVLFILTPPTVMACPARLYPLKQPHNYTPPVPRWTLQLPSDVTHIHTLYIGIQRHSSTPASLDAYTAASHSISTYLQRPPAALATDTLAVTSGFDTPGTRVWVAYWPTSTPPPPPDLLSIYHSLSSSAIGLWTESFTVPTTRLECNYSSLAHMPGLAALPGASFPAHSLSAYWGAARDRIPGSGWDLYPAASEARTQPPSSPPVGLGERLTGLSYDNMVHIRSGQW